MAFVALHSEGAREVEIGVCRYAPSDKADARELAITIADQWQHTELPQLLLRSLVQCAKQFSIHELFAVELYDNQAMHDFALQNGMAVKHDLEEPTQVVYSLRIC